MKRKSEGTRRYYYLKVIKGYNECLEKKKNIIKTEKKKDSRLVSTGGFESEIKTKTRL